MFHFGSTLVYTGCDEAMLLVKSRERFRVEPSAPSLAVDHLLQEMVLIKAKSGLDGNLMKEKLPNPNYHHRQYEIVKKQAKNLLLKEMLCLTSYVDSTIFCQNSSLVLKELTESVPRLLILEKAPNEQQTVLSFCSFLFFPRQNVRRVDWIWQNEFPSATWDDDYHDHPRLTRILRWDGKKK